MALWKDQLQILSFFSANDWTGMIYLISVVLQQMQLPPKNITNVNFFILDSLGIENLMSFGVNFEAILDFFIRINRLIYQDKRNWLTFLHSYFL